MSELILSQLQEAASQLSDQETDLMAQLTAIQEQRQGLQTVIEMFQSPVNSNGAAAVAEVMSNRTPKPSDTPSSPPSPAKTADLEISASKNSAVAAKPPAKAKPGRKPGPKPKAKAEKIEPSAKASRKPPRKTRSGKAPNWSRHIQEPFKKTPLPDVVANILKSQPDQAFKIADVMEVIFKVDMPKASFLKARNRVSNILSAGARTKEWYRGRGGRYSIKEKALAS
ncbi:MAG: hypothetical protein AAFZ80_01085 [Cyanobacteria bacterium P01_A01_bin.105]